MKTVYQRIILAGEKARGIRLSPSEVRTLAGDEAIIRAAQNDDDIEGGACPSCMGLGTPNPHASVPIRCSRCKGEGFLK